VRKAVLAFLLVVGSGFQPVREGPRLNLLLITLDTVRADRIGAYGYLSARTPNLDRLAAEGTIYENAFAHSPVTLPSHATLLTGRLPNEHGVRSNSLYRLADAETTLAEVLGDVVYRTAAFVSAAVLDHRFGLSQGFETYDDDVNPLGLDQLIAEREASAVSSRASAWLREIGSSPFFLWVHFFDPHHPYSPPEPFLSRYSGSPYDGEIAYCDEQIGRLLSVLKSLGVRERTLVLVCSDHGRHSASMENRRTESLFTIQRSGCR
jgi:arylsulfatase A-like enzyme